MEKSSLAGQYSVMQEEGPDFMWPSGSSYFAFVFCYLHSPPYPHLLTLPWFSAKSLMLSLPYSGFFSLPQSCEDVGPAFLSSSL